MFVALEMNPAYVQLVDGAYLFDVIENMCRETHVFVERPHDDWDGKSALGFFLVMPRPGNPS